MSTVRRVLGPLAVAGGLIGAAVLGGATAHRQMIRHYRRMGAGPLVPGAGDRPRADRTYSVVADDGVALYVDEFGDPAADLTVVFSHGWTLQAGAWATQIDALRGDDLRLVVYDQRSHGRSTRAPDGHATIEYLAGDLAAVVATAAPAGPVVLIGHSMGGMAILALVAARPDLLQGRIVGVGLVSTSANEVDAGPARLTRLNGANPLLVYLTAVARRYPALFERGRSVAPDAVWLLTRAWGFGDGRVPGFLVDALDEMISHTPVEVIASFAPSLYRHDQRAALPLLAGTPLLIAVGEQDRMTPPERSREMAAALPGAELLVVPGAGHMLPMEAPGPLNAALARLLETARVAIGS